jgi:hypothetical protein
MARHVGGIELRVTVAAKTRGLERNTWLLGTAHHVRVKPGRWYRPESANNPNTGTFATTGIMTAHPLWVSARTRFDQLACSQEGAVNGGAIRVGIYADEGRGKPDALLLDAGLITFADGASLILGTKAIDITLDPGLYWLAAVDQGATSTSHGSISAQGTTAVGSTVLSGVGTRAGYYKLGVTGVLPANWGAPDTATNNMMLVHIRVAEVLETLAPEVILKRRRAMRGLMYPGLYYGPEGTAGLAAPAQDVAYARPLFVGRETPIDQLAQYSGSASTFATLGIYTDDGEGHPYRLILSGDTAALAANNPRSVGVSLTLPPGLYWTAGVVRGATPGNSLTGTGIGRTTGVSVDALTNPIGYKASAAAGLPMEWPSNDPVVAAENPLNVYVRAA